MENDKISVKEALKMAFDYAGYYRDKDVFSVADMILEYSKRKENGESRTDSSSSDPAESSPNKEGEDISEKK